MKSCCGQKEESSTAHKTIVLVGNPNVGKTLIFNHLTGSTQRVANFPGVTVSSMSGILKLGDTDANIVDLPGIYGFASMKREEQVASRFIVETSIDLIVNVVDASKIERNLLLTLQLAELGVPMVIVMTHIDRANPERIIPTLEQLLDVPIHGINATRVQDLKRLERILYDGIGSLPVPKKPIIGKMRKVLDDLLATGYDWRSVLGYIFGVGDISIEDDIDSFLFDRGYESVEDLRLDTISEEYRLIESLGLSEDVHEEFSEVETRLDKVLLRGWTGIPIFFLVMTGVFWMTFFVATPVSDLLDAGLILLADYVRSSLSNELLASFLADGVIGGIGFVLVFIPQISILFFFLAVLDHSGYMARVVFIMDRYLNRVNISGRSLAPLLLGFGCNVPAVLATSSIPDENEKITIALVNPFLPCSARFPVFVVFGAAVFKEYAAVAVASMYFSGIIIAVVMMFVLRKTVLPGTSASLLLELNDLNFPPIRTVLFQSYRQVRKFIEGAATWMGLGILIMWLLSITGPSGYLGPGAMETQEGIHSTWIYTIGNILQPLFAPFNWDARMVTALLFGFVAKEIVVGSLGLLYGTQGSDTLISKLATSFTPVSGFAYMLFVLTYIPCIGTYFALRKEVGKRWANFSVILGLVVAWLLAFLTTIIGGLLFG